MNEQGSEETIILNQYVTDETSTVKKLYDMDSIDADVYAVVGSARAKSPLAKLQKDIMLYDKQIYTRTQVILNMEDDIDKERLLKEISEIEQLKSALQQAQAKIEEQRGDLDTRERELFHANMRAKVSEGSKKVDAVLSDLISTTKTEKARQKDKTALINSEKQASA